MADLKLFLDSCICKRLCLCHCASVFTVRGRRCSCVRRMWVWTACCLCRSFKACQNSTQVEGQGGYTEGGSVSGVWCWWVLVQWSGCLSTNDSSACFHTQSRQLLWNININEAHGRKHTSHTFFFVSFFFFFKWKFFSVVLFSFTGISLWHPSNWAFFFFFFFFFFSPLDFSQGELKENIGVTTFDEVGPVTASQNRSLLVSTALLSSFTAEIKRLGIHQKMAAIRSQHHLKEY